MQLNIRRGKALSGTMAMVLLLGALIGFAVQSEISQRNKVSGKNQINQAREEQSAETTAEITAEHPNDAATHTMRPRNASLDLLSEAGWGHTEQIRVLLDGGADVNTRGDNGDTPLIAAAFLGHSETVKLLLEKGADVNAKNNLGSTALIEAAATDKPKIVEMLATAGADTSARNITGLTALDVAQRENHIEMVRLLKSIAAKLPAQPPAYPAFDAGLEKAVIDGDIDKIRSLIAGGAALNARDKKGWTALMHAAFRGNIGAVRALLSGKADPNLAEASFGRTALILATTQGHADVVQALLGSGADPNAQDRMGDTAMSIARQTGQSNIGRLLKQAGVKTPLYNQVLSQP
jgi:ankyrin repeat protein